MGRGPKWKREVIQDHKFDFIDVHSFTQHSALLWAGYLWVYIEMVKGLAVYVVDTQTGSTSSPTHFQQFSAGANV